MTTLFPAPMLGEQEVKLSLYVPLGRCYRIGEVLYISPDDWDQGVEHCGELRLMDLGSPVPRLPPPWI